MEDTFLPLTIAPSGAFGSRLLPTAFRMAHSEKCGEFVGVRRGNLGRPCGIPVPPGARSCDRSGAMRCA